MKKVSTLLLSLMLTSFIPSTSYASIKTPKESPISVPLSAEESNLLILRLDEINTMDKTALKSSEKKELRKEVKSIQARLTTGGGVYVSVGALIIILLLLIILF